jgi:hypothetical protein
MDTKSMISNDLTRKEDESGQIWVGVDEVDGGKVLQVVDQECGICVSPRFAAPDLDQQIQRVQKPAARIL